MDSDQILARYQRAQFGARDGETCLTELLPLPSPSTKDWNYAEWSKLPWLRSRDDYLQRKRPERENELRRKIVEHKPKVVIFYGLELPECSVLPSWASIAGGHFDQAISGERMLLWRQNADTVFFAMRHPSACGDDYFRRIGNFLHDKHGGLFAS